MTRKVLRVECGCCGKVLTEPGGLLFGPPEEDDRTKKTHLCAWCFGVVDDFVYKRWSLGRPKRRRT